MVVLLSENVVLLEFFKIDQELFMNFFGYYFRFWKESVWVNFLFNKSIIIFLFKFFLMFTMWNCCFRLLWRKKIIVFLTLSNSFSGYLGIFWILRRILKVQILGICFSSSVHKWHDIAKIHENITSIFDIWVVWFGSFWGVEHLEHLIMFKLFWS